MGIHAKVLVIMALVIFYTKVNDAFGKFDHKRHHLLLMSSDGSRSKRELFDTDEDYSETNSSENEVNIELEKNLLFLNETARIYSCHVTTDIRHRYARTQVTSSVLNKNPKIASEVTFQMILPEAAFISKFIMEVQGQIFTAYVKEKEEAKKVYTEAQNKGLGAGLVEVSARHANVFNINLNVKPSSSVTFNLTYEEFLIRKLGNYEHAIHIRPEQISEIPDYSISVRILESQNITQIKVPKLVTNGLENSDPEAEGNRDAEIIQTGNYAIINWKPTTGDKELMTHDSGMKFLVRYDIQHDSAAGEILLMNGYFVHFFVPSNILPLRKHVVYVLDTSGSMHGRKMEQMKHVMSTVMDDLKPDDYFNIILFSTNSKVAMPEGAADRVMPILATEFALRKAHQLIDSLVASGGTNIDSALKDAFAITSRVKPTPQNEGIGTLPDNVESLIIFLTDGDPTIGATRPEVIISNSRERNTVKVPVYTISFGTEPDFEFLKKLAVQNFGFARKIYEGGDADIQIRGFYKEISSPLLSNITFKYTTNSSSSVKKLTQQKFPNIFAGAEIAVAGYLPRPRIRSSAPAQQSTFLAVDIDANGRDGQVTLSGDDLLRSGYDLLPAPTNQSSMIRMEDEFLERLWAYITIKQLLEIHPDQNGTTVESDYEFEDFGQEWEEPIDRALPVDEPIESEFTTEVEETTIRDNSEFSVPIPMTSVSSKSNETARERALRLALKYGFVTPITSLVVVKPEDSSNLSRANHVVNLEEAKAASQVNRHTSSRGLSGPPGMSLPLSYSSPYAGPPGLPGMSYGRSVSPRGPTGSYTSSSTNAFRSRSFPVPQMSTRNHDVSMAISSKSLPALPNSVNVVPDWLLNFGETQGRANFMTISSNDNTHESISNQANWFLNMAKHHGRTGMSSRKVPSHGQESGSPRTPGRETSRPTSTTPNPNGRLTSIAWPISKDSAGKSFIVAYSTKYSVLNDFEVVPHPTRGFQTKCTGGMRHKRFQGKCQHLKDCIRNEFKQNFDLYINNYFCEIPAGNKQYAGVCCQ